MDGLENVEKVDNKGQWFISQKIQMLRVCCIMNNTCCISKTMRNFDVLKYYYNINLSYDRHPFTIDKFAQYPDLLSSMMLTY